MLKNKKNVKLHLSPVYVCTLYQLSYKQSKFRSEIFDTLSDFNFLIIHISNLGFTTKKQTLSFSKKKLTSTYTASTGTALHCFLFLLLSEKKGNGESEADPASLFLVWSLQLHHRTGSRAAKSGDSQGIRLVDVDVFWSGLLHHQHGTHPLLSHQEERRGLPGQMEIEISCLDCIF